MSTELISILLTVIFGVPTLIAYFQSTRTKIVYLEDENINLYNSTVKRFNKLTIKYDSVDIKDDLFLLKGYIICDGINDISGENNIELCLTKADRWLDFQVISHSKGLKVQHTIQEDTVKLHFGLFKSSEFLKFEALVEAKQGVNLDFSHRIQDIPKIKKLYKESVNRNLFTIIPALVGFALLILLLSQFNDIRRYNVSSYYVENNQKVDNDDLLFSQSYDSAIEELAKTSNGIFLMVRKSEPYDIRYHTYDIEGFEKQHFKASVYFRRKIKVFDVLFFLFASFATMIYSYTSFTGYFKERKFLKFLKYKD